MILRIKLFLLKYKMYGGYVLSFILFLLLLGKGGTTYIERVEELVQKNIQTITSPDLFTESRPFIVKPGKDGLKEVTYKLDESGENIGVLTSKTLEETEEETQIRGSLLFTDKRIEIENQISLYLQDIVNKRYENLNKYYTPYSQTEIATSRDNWSKIKKLSGNFIIEESIPLYDHYTSKALVKTVAKGKYEDTLRKQTLERIELYSIFDSKTSTFQILNPEYIPIKRLEKEGEVTTQLIERTQYSPTHNLLMEIDQTFIQFPNKILFNIQSKVSENVTYNRIRVQLYKKDWNLVYEETLGYKDFDPNVLWNRTLFQSKLGYGTQYFLELNFPKDKYNILFDESLSEAGFLDMSQYKVVFTPINDNVVNIVYPSFTFEY